MASFASFIPKKKGKSGKVKFDNRSVRQSMTLQESTSLRIREEAKELQGVSGRIAISDNEIGSYIEKMSEYPLFTTMNTKLLLVCFALMPTPYSEAGFGKKVVENETDIFQVFGVNDEIRKMKLKEDLFFYSMYINFMNTNVQDEESDYEESDYEESESEYESD